MSTTIFTPDEVTIVRKKGDEYDFEQISTRKKLAGSNISATAARKNIIARLRKDPSVVLVLEDKDGHCEESVERDGFTLTVSHRLREDHYRQSSAGRYGFASRRLLHAKRLRHDSPAH